MALKGNFVAQTYANEAAANTALGGSRATGSVYYDSGATKLKVWTGSAWTAFGGGGFPTDIPSTGNLICHLDASNSSSYGGSGTTWTDLQGNYDFTVNASSFVSASSPDPAHFNFVEPDASTDAYMAYNSTGITRSAANSVVVCAHRGPWRESIGSDTWRERVMLSQKQSTGLLWQVFSASTTRRIAKYEGGTIYPEQWGDDTAPSGSTPMNRYPEHGPDTQHVANMYTWRTQSTDSSNTPTFQFSINGHMYAGSDASNMSNAQSTKLFHNIGGSNSDSTTSGYGWGKIVAVLVYDKILTTAEEMQIYAHYHPTCHFAGQGVYDITGGFT